MKHLLISLLALCSLPCTAQIQQESKEEILFRKILADPSANEIEEALDHSRKLDLSPESVMVHDTIILANNNRLYIVSSEIEGYRHYGAVIIPSCAAKKYPVVIFATGGDGIHTQFDITSDFNHKAVQFPAFLGAGLDSNFIILIPGFRGQELIIGNKSFMSEGLVSDAFDGAATDALGFLNVAIKTFHQADEDRIAIFGGSRGGTVSLLAAARDPRIKKAVVVAAPTDMKALYQLYPDQFKLLFFKELFAGTITEAEARRRFIASSPIYFTNQLPAIQLHHDSGDPFVPLAFAKKLADSLMIKNNRTQFYTYNEGIHGFWDDKEYWKRVLDFLGVF
ncbi:MAG: prolyl oligopeptidase family serine peptidase [Chitinophagaceae bacterium]